MPDSCAPADAAPLLVALLRDAAAEPAPDRLIPAALDRLRRHVRADGCAIVLTADGDAAPARWTSGDAGRDDGTTVERWTLSAAGETVGALVVAGASAPNADDSGACAAEFFAAIVRGASEVARLAGEVDAERRFAADVIDALPLGVYVTDRDHRVRLWNRKREVGTSGISRDVAIGRSIFEVMPRQDASLMRAELDAVLATGELQQIHTESRASGEARTYRLSKIPMTVEDRAPTHVITVGEDVTEWRGALDRTAQAEKLAAVGQLAAGVMHEINNPLGTIAACAETMTLALGELPRERQPMGFGEYLRIIDHEVHRCRRIVDGLLNFSRAREVRRVRVALDTVVEQTLSLLRHHARFKRVPVRLALADAADGGPAVNGDPDQLTQVAMAILLNAADAVAAAEPRPDGETPRGLTVRTRADVDAGAAVAVLEIADDGTGIPREALAKIFDPFFTTKPPGEGTGLGLAIVYGLVRDLGGRIDVESEPGAGSTFRVILPAA